jgi:hypothetical protein
MVRPIFPRRPLLGLLAALALAAGAAEAQLPRVPKLPTRPTIRDLVSDGAAQRARAADTTTVPVSYRPPPGMCRIWLDSVPPAQQPAPTECSVAVRNRPANGRVLFGDDYVNERDGARDRGKDRRDRPERPSGPSAAGPAYGDHVEAELLDLQPPRDSIRRDPRPRRPAGPTPGRVAPGRGDRVDRGRPVDRDDDDPADEFEAGYRAGYEDAVRGRAPQVRGVAVVGAGGTTAVVVPPGGDPRYFNNGSYPPPGRANGTCLDRDQDGWCDDPRFGAPVCRDLDGDGRCDDYAAEASAPYPSDLPSMRAGTEVQGGRGSREAIRWLGTAEVVARPSGGRAGGTPYRILWFDANTNALLQAWTDRDADGIADRVEIFRGGRRVKLLGR